MYLSNFKCICLSIFCTIIVILKFDLFSTRLMDGLGSNRTECWWGSIRVPFRWLFFFGDEMLICDFLQMNFMKFAKNTGFLPLSTDHQLGCEVIRWMAFKLRSESFVGSEMYSIWFCSVHFTLAQFYSFDIFFYIVLLMFVWFVFVLIEYSVSTSAQWEKFK